MLSDWLQFSFLYAHTCFLIGFCSLFFMLTHECDILFTVLCTLLVMMLTLSIRRVRMVVHCEEHYSLRSKEERKAVKAG